MSHKMHEVFKGEAYTEANPKYLKEFWDVKDTPFTIVKVQDDLDDDPYFFVACGSFKVSIRFDKLKDAIENAYEITWNKIAAMIQHIFNLKLDDNG